MTTFRFKQNNNAEVDEQLYSDILNLNSFNDDQLVQFTDAVLTFIINKNVSLPEQISALSQETGIALGVLKNSVRGTLFFFKAAIKATLTNAYLKEDLVKFGITDEKADLMASRWKQSFAALSRAMISQTLMVSQIVDIEWRFGVTASNTELQQVGSTFLQLKLVLDKGTNTESVFMELTLPQFYQFLHEMETAKQHLDYFS